jgi:hypothetical protein
VKNWDTDSCIVLLKAGASPDGDRRNLSTPLHIACQDGYAIGVKVRRIERRSGKTTVLPTLYKGITLEIINLDNDLQHSDSDVWKTLLNIYKFLIPEIFHRYAEGDPLR